MSDTDKKFDFFDEKERRKITFVFVLFLNDLNDVFDMLLII